MIDKNNQAESADILYTLSNAFGNAIAAGFLTREHATGLFKSCLQSAGFVIPKKNIEKDTSDSKKDN